MARSASVARISTELLGWRHDRPPHRMKKEAGGSVTLPANASSNPGASDDLSDRARSERELRAAHDTFRHLVEHSPFGIYAVDADFRLSQVSAGAQKVFEHVRPLLGRDFAEVLRVIWPEPFATDTIARFRHTLDSGERYHSPSTVERRNDIDDVEAYDWKIERVGLPDGRLGVVCHFYDLSERIRYESLLQKGEEQLQLAMAAANAGSWTLEVDTGEFRASDRAREIHGLPRDGSLTQDLALGRVHPADRAAVESALQSALQDAAPFHIEHRVLHPDGTLHWVASHAQIGTGADKRFLVGLVQDITDRKNAEVGLREREATHREIALMLQRALLPTRLPQHPCADFAERYIAGRESLLVGGDWYDAFVLPNGRIVLTVGDVVGHGLVAAAAMGQLRTALAALAPAHQPASLLAELDEFCARTEVSDFATLCVAFYDPATGDLDYASAGHPFILVISPDGSVRRLEDAQSPPLTGYPTTERSQGRTNLEPGTVLILYSDGLIERRGESIDRGLERLENAARAAFGSSVDDLCSAILNALDVHETPADDVVILVARLRHDSEELGAARCGTPAAAALTR